MKTAAIPHILIVVLLLTVTACQSIPAHQQQSEGPYQAMGIKIGELTSNSVIIWTRLSRDPKPVPKGGPMPRILYKQKEGDDWGEQTKGRRAAAVKVEFPEGVTVNDLEGAVPGSKGEIRVSFKKESDAAWSELNWQAVDPDQDFTRQVRLENLDPDTQYLVRVESRKGGGTTQGEMVNGTFRTAPDRNQARKVVFAVSTGQAYGDQDMEGGGFMIYDQIQTLDPDFFVHTGDIIYYDRKAKTEALARWHWQRMYSLPTNVRFHNQVPSYFMKDDHDTWVNDCWPGMETGYMGEFTFEQGLAIFPQEVPMGERTWRTIRWGKDLQVWLVEGRDYRSPNTMEDGPQKTIWGEEQKAWFKETVEISDASFRLLISPTPVVGPDRTKKKDNHSNESFSHEGNEIREFISQQKNMFVICGDRHWQYVSQDAKTGLKEYSCGPASDAHAGGWSNDQRYPEHLYLNVIGGFLSVTVERENGGPVIMFRHHGVDGKILNEDRIFMN